MRLRIVALLVPLVLALAACGGGSDDTTSSGPGGGPDDPPASGTLDAEVLFLAEGEYPLEGDPAVEVLDPADPDGAATLFIEPERDAAVEAVQAADLDGRTLLGGTVQVGCFTAGGVSVEVIDDGVVFHAEDVDDQEGEVECARAVVTAALVSVATDALPDGFGDDPTDPTGPTEPTSPEPPGDDEVPGEVVQIDPARHEADDGAGPGLVRDQVDYEALLGRYGLGEPDPAVLARLESGADVLVADAVSGGCELPTDATVIRTDTDLALELDHPPVDPDLACDEAVSALVVVAVSSAAVEGIETVDGDPADGPTGVGVVHAIEPLDIDAERSAERFDGSLDPTVYPGLPDLDLGPVAEDGQRLVFVVEACQPATAELIADLGSGTVRAETQQTGGDIVDCDALSPFLVVADLAADHADLDPVTD
ncbi:MAG TPA: hypothetical protein VK507_04820 [Iamia sp.]|nr:hypothetical protein [Iamia sp.]